MSWNKGIDAALDAAITEKRIVGGVLLVSKDGALAYHRAVGLADRESNIPMAETTPFRQASLTKPITTVVVLDLIQQGKLSLEDKASRWLSDFNPRFQGEALPITIRQLLTHTSGLGYPLNTPEDEAYAKAYVSWGLDQPGLSLEENLRRLASAPLHSRPGTAWRYSIGLDVLGGIAERVASRPFAELVEERVLRPLGMEATGFVAKDPKRLATPYADGQPEPVRMWEGMPVPFRGGLGHFAPSRQLDPKSYPSGGAGISGTASDYLRFLEALRTRNSFVAKGAIDEMFRDQIPGLDTSLMLGPGMGFSFGAAVVRDASANLPPGLIRWGGAFGHSWWIDPTSKTSAVLLTNTAYEGMAGKVHMDVVKALWGG